MNNQIPHAIQDWLHTQEWTLTSFKQLEGGFAASIFQLEVDTPEQHCLPLIYKRFLSGRAHELTLYQSILPHLRNYTPKLYGIIQQAHELGIVIEDVGHAVKSLLISRNTEEKYPILRQAIHALAELHTTYEHVAQTWFQEGWIQAYSVESSQNWTDDAVQACQWLAEQGMTSIQKSDLQQIRYMLERYDSQIRGSITGRMTICHGDPHLENIAYQESRVRFIDWEYTCFTIPQRDLSILLQDLLDEDSFNYACDTYWDYLRKRGWDVDTLAFTKAFHACMFDNTLMMLGWEIQKARTGYLSFVELEKILQVKLSWLQRSFQFLF